LFILIFWGWLNGSLYHDLHGNLGLRTRLMTLWQMMIIAALAIAIDHSPGKRYFNTTIVFMIMQLFITYLWWSVGFYDKEHRRYNKPYTILFLLSLGLMGLSLATPVSWLQWIFPLVLICNYLPPFLTSRLLRRSSVELDLSHSMFERLGLFTIIIFGELVLGVVNGINETHVLDFSAWLNFALAIAVVFSLWWIFFTLVSNRETKKGFFNATLLELLYIRALISLGLIAACFSSLFDPHGMTHTLYKVFGCAMAVFLTCNSLMMGLIEYPDFARSIKRPVRISLLITAAIFLFSAFIHLPLESLYYLLAVIIVIVAEIFYVNSVYFSLDIEETNETDNLSGVEE
jgi:low temperature requirement protein LtrA